MIPTWFITYWLGFFCAFPTWWYLGKTYELNKLKKKEIKLQEMQERIIEIYGKMEYYIDGELIKKSIHQVYKGQNLNIELKKNDYK